MALVVVAVVGVDHQEMLALATEEIVNALEIEVFDLIEMATVEVTVVKIAFSGQLMRYM